MRKNAKGDKNNGNIDLSLMRRFRRALDASDLFELRLQNRRYTWSNGRTVPTLVHLKSWTEYSVTMTGLPCSRVLASRLY
jgi:hypothetical protein